MGGPRIIKQRSAPSQVIVVNNQLYVVDCGSGVAKQLVLVNCDLNKLKAVFITHHHCDHNLDYGNLLYQSLLSGLVDKVSVYGPYPIEKITRRYLELNDYDIKIQIVEQGRVQLEQLMDVREVIKEGAVMEDENVKVSCVLVNHPPVFPASQHPPPH